MKFIQRPSWHTRYAISHDTLVIDLGKSCRVISSAVRGGGISQARYVLNHQVPGNPVKAPHERQIWPEPSRYLGQIAKRLGITNPFVGLMTAVNVRQVVMKREQCQDLWVEAWVTVGVTNAVRAGEFPPKRQSTNSAKAISSHQNGTINIILVTNAKLSSSALVGAVQVATESKAGAFIEEKVKSWTGLVGATGTGTDAVVVVSGKGPPSLRFSGTHTEIGGMVGRLIRKAVTMKLRRSRDLESYLT